MTFDSLTIEESQLNEIFKLYRDAVFIAVCPSVTEIIVKNGGVRLASLCR